MFSTEKMSAALSGRCQPRHVSPRHHSRASMAFGSTWISHIAHGIFQVGL